jgi:hypothetical protein
MAADQKVRAQWPKGATSPVTAGCYFRSYLKLTEGLLMDAHGPTLIGFYDYCLIVLWIEVYAAYAAFDLARPVTAARGMVRFACLSGGAFAMKTRSSIVLLLLFGCVCNSARAIDSTSAPSTTKLSISASHVDIGRPVTLTARVLLGPMPVRHGAIMFCDANASRCQGLAILGVAQIDSGGTASIKLTLGAGTYAIKAVFQGTPHSIPSLSGSTSATQALIVEASSGTLPREGNQPVDDLRRK